MATAEWILAAYLGAAHTMSAPLSVARPQIGTEITFRPVDYRGESFSPPLYYGYRLSYFLPTDSWIGFEGEFIHAKVYAHTDRSARVHGKHGGQLVQGMVPIDDVVERFSMSHGLNFVLMNLAARRTLGSRNHVKAQVVGRLGVGPTVPHAETTIDGMRRDAYELGAVALHAAGGAEIRLGWRLGAVAEYKFTRTRQTITIDGGKARGSFASHHAVIGITWHFRG
jgi:hypothetical protein